MAYTKIHAVKATVDQAIAYICSPEKTDGQRLVSSFAYSPETAAYDFKFALSKTRQSDPNLAFHLIQSFAPGEVGIEEAHRIGQEMAAKLLDGKYSYVISTHIDRGHIHNHFIWCAADNVEHKKYHDCKKTYWEIRKLSDQLCQDHNLSVIIPGQKRGMQYAEWTAQKSSGAWKAQIRKDIDACIREAQSYGHFVELMKAKGYEIQGESLEAGSGKYIRFRPMDKERFVRGSEKSLGSEYTKERISDRIVENLEKKKTISMEETNAMKLGLDREKKDPADLTRRSRRMIDTSDEKFQNSPGLLGWANRQNLKTAASIYAEKGSLEDLNEKILEKKAVVRKIHETVKELEEREHALGEILHYAEQYVEMKPYHDGYEKAWNKDRYFRRNESKLIMFGGAERMLRKAGVKVETMDVEKIRGKYGEYRRKRGEMQKEMAAVRKTIVRMEKEKGELDKYFKDTAKTSQRSNPIL